MKPHSGPIAVHPHSSKQPSWFAKYWPALLIGSAWLWLFWPMMSGRTVCGFRDSAYLYYPLFKWIDTQWAAGDIPLWNPYDQFGVPVIADGSSSVFYPGKLIFWFRFLSYESRYGIYLAIHVLIAAVSCYWFARRMGCQQGGAAFAAISYAFGGSVLFQVCNVIYLVGAAWLPAALGCLWLMFRRRSIAWAVAGGVCCALIVLGGDPQLVYNIGLIGVGTIVGIAWRARRTGHLRGDFGFLSPVKAVARPTGNLIVLVFVTAVLSAIQILPLRDWTKESDRAKSPFPRNIYELAESLQEPGAKGRGAQIYSFLYRMPRSYYHAGQVYQFSQPPWTMAELVVPNFSGKPFPTNTRWTEALPGADRMWVPSLYCGFLAALFALFACRLWGKRRRQVWLTRIGLFFAIGSFGWYGLGWLVAEICGLTTLPFDVGPQVGGLYWFMVVLLPKYVLFRYPAKLFVIAALAMCVLAGFSVKRINRIGGSRFCFYFVSGILASCLLLLTAWPELRLHHFFATVPPDILFGPVDPVKAATGLFLAVVQVVLVCFALGVVVERFRFPRHQVWLLLSVIATIDVLVANQWMIANVDSRVFARDSGRQANTAPTYDSYPPTWTAASSENRLAEIVDWQRKMLFPKHHLEIPQRNEFSFSSIERRVGQSSYSIHECTERLEFAAVFAGRESEVLDRVRPGNPGEFLPATIVEQRNGFYRITADAPVDSFLCVQNLVLPDWEAVVITDDATRDSPIHAWLYSLQAVEIPAGKCTVELSYHPQAFYRGAWISGFGWSILGLLVVVRWARISRHV